ncbi:MAG: hypothetical protein DPW18_09265 [Chloroflexi bacterium]|nr:hypothetical protein [Chloroflexota bacterium]MDL1941629.1 hypothetical protein [Chloroflexi bacterium CFX2]
MSSSIIGKTLLNQYRVEEFIAQTPLGELHRAVDERSNKRIALTLLPEAVARDVEAIKELETKSGRLQAISHPNLNRYLGLFQTPTLAFLAEEWVDGPSLKDVLAKAPVNAGEALIYAKALCGALEALHKQNFLHLNLAPELIRINQRGEIVLGGTANAHPIGKETLLILSRYPLHYASPEQLLERSLTTAADMYSLAVLLYELVTARWINGRQTPKTAEAVYRAQIEGTPPAPAAFNKELPDHFSRMILWALRKNPEERLKTTTELLSSLALAARVPLDKVPLRADPIPAPVTGAILREWEFLPPLKINNILNDAAPLEERLATIASPPKPRRARVGFVPIFFLLLIGGFLSLFWFARPAVVEVPIPTPIQFTPFAADYTPPPTPSSTPKPVDPHGGRIVFTCTRGDYNQLCMINRDGTELTQVTDMAASNYYPVFTPDGSSILFASNRSGPFDLFLLNFKERQVFQITENVGNVVSPDYSPDGRFIVFANRVGEGPTAIWMVNADGLNPRLVYTGANDIVAVAWSPDGEKIAYAMADDIPQEYQIYTMDTNGKNHLKISQGLQGIGGSVDWSPDGLHLLVHAGPFGDKDIFRIEAATGNFTQLTDGGNNAGASYSPDGQFIVFNSLRNDDQADLYIMRADGSGQTRLTNDPEPDWGARWSQ